MGPCRAHRAPARELVIGCARRRSLLVMVAAIVVRLAALASRDPAVRRAPSAMPIGRRADPGGDRDEARPRRRRRPADADADTRRPARTPAADRSTSRAHAATRDRAYAEFLAPRQRRPRDGRAPQPRADDRRAGAGPDAVRTAAVDDPRLRRRRARLAARAPAGRLLRRRRTRPPGDARGVRRRGRRGSSTGPTTGGGLAGLAALGNALDAAQTAGDALDDVRHASWRRRRARADRRRRSRRSGTSRAAGSWRSAARRSRSATTGSSARRRSRSGPPGRGRIRSRSRSRCGRRATRPSWPSGSCGPRACSTARRSLGTAGGDPALAQPARRHDRRPPVAAVRRLEGRGASFRRDRVVRDLRQGLDRRGRAPRRRRSPAARSSRAR